MITLNGPSVQLFYGLSNVNWLKIIIKLQSACIKFNIIVKLWNYLFTYLLRLNSQIIWKFHYILLTISNHSYLYNMMWSFFKTFLFIYFFFFEPLNMKLYWEDIIKFINLVFIQLLFYVTIFKLFSFILNNTNYIIKCIINVLFT